MAATAECCCDQTSAAGQLLQPGQSIRPQMNEATAVALVRRLYGLEPIKVIELPSYDDRNYRVVVAADSGRHDNPHLGDICPDGYVLKVLNSLDSLKRHVEAEHEMLRILARNKIGCPQPVINVRGEDKSLELIDETQSGEDSDTTASGSSSRLHIVRLLTFIPGERLVTVPYTPRLLHRFGQYAGVIDRTLEGFQHPALDNHRTLWSLDNVVHLRQFTFAIADERNKNLVLDIIAAFENNVLPKARVIHGDYNEQNTIVRRADDRDEFDIVGVIDFSDSLRSHYVYEVAIAMMYAMLDSRIVDPLSVGGHVLAGYLTGSGVSDRPQLIGQEERLALRTCVAARFAQSLTMGAYSYSLDPGNEYLLTTAKRGWPTLDLLWRQTTESELYARWDAVMSESYGMSFFDTAAD